MQDTAGSILIAAHNEARTLGGCLEPLRPALELGLYELAIVSNGSTDRTASTARSLVAGAPRAVVRELDVASKSAALREGDQRLTLFPRVYLDADISIDRSTMDSLLEELRAASGPAVAAPSLIMDTSASSWVVRAYFRVWTTTPYVADGIIGMGVYAVNEAGRRRFGVFPDLLNDDEWVARHFAPHERLTTAGTFTARAAQTLPALLRQRARVQAGNGELSEAGSAAQRDTSLGDLAAGLRRREYAPADALCFLVVVLGTRALAGWRRLRGTSRQWSMDVSSRTAQSADHAPARNR